jgi:hypothetical protein
MTTDPTRSARYRRSAQLCILLLVLATIGSVAHAQVSQRVRGTITSVEGDVLSVRTREGKPVQIKLGDKAVVAAAKAIELGDLKPGDYVGTTTRKRSDGALVAVEVHTLPRTAKPGHMAWDLEPGSMMTNGTVGTVAQSAGARELKLDYQGGAQTVIVPPGTPIVTTVPADRSALRPGEYIFTTAQAAADGTLVAQRITVSRDGVRPPQ